MSEGFPDRSIPGGIVHNPGSSHSREMARWEMGINPYGVPGRPRMPGLNPNVPVVGFQEYPAAMYRMARGPIASQFIVAGFEEARDEDHRARLEAAGYRMGRKAAQDYVIELEQMVATAAAERNYQDRNMSEKAKAEAESVELTTIQHVPVIPEKKKRGRPRKVEVTA